MCATRRPAKYGAHGAADTRKDRALFGRGTAGLQPFEHASHGISLELLQFVPVDDPIKISRLKIANRSGRARRLSVTAYVEWVLGETAQRPRLSS